MKGSKSVSSEPLSEQETLDGNKAKFEKEVLLRDYDDSSDEEETLDYNKVPKIKIETAKERLLAFKLSSAAEINSIKGRLERKHDRTLQEKLDVLQEEKLELEYKIDEAKAIFSDNSAYVMEIAGRELIYQFRPEYRRRKHQAFEKIDFEIKDAATYNSMLISTLKKHGIITGDQAKKME